MSHSPAINTVVPATISDLWVLYDDQCRLCVRSRRWLEHQPAFVRLHFRSCHDREVRTACRADPWLGDQLVVLAGDGRLWAGPPAFIMCLWALRDYRGWSYRLSGRRLWPLAMRFFQLVSSQRKTLGALLLDHSSCADEACSYKRVASRGPYR